MIINKLKLTNFRNYNNIEINFSIGTNVIIGNNGVGKTNIIEAINLISNTKSFRTNDDRNLIKDNLDFAKVEVNSQNNTLCTVINRQQKNYFINDEKINSAGFLGKLNVVLFEPSELNFFKESPKLRRRLIDIELSKISKEYMTNLYVYHKLLKEKNSLLKEEKIDEILLDTINEQLLKPLEVIMKKRKEFIDFINRHLSNYFQKLSATRKQVNVSYKRMCDIITKENIEKKINLSKISDFKYNYAYSGIHKDDYEFYLDDNLVVNNASQGQKRLIMIAFKLCLIDYIKKETKEEPILLLDDILSELDIANQQRLLEFLNNNLQIIITTTDVENIKLSKHYRLIQIK